MKFPARKCCLQNKIALAVDYEWHHVNVFIDRDQEHPLSGTFWMLDDIHVLFLKDQDGNFVERDPSVYLKLGAFFLVPDNIHSTIYDIMHTMSNRQLLSAATAPNKRQTAPPNKTAGKLLAGLRGPADTMSKFLRSNVELGHSLNARAGKSKLSSPQPSVERNRS